MSDLKKCDRCGVVYASGKGVSFVVDWDHRTFYMDPRLQRTIGTHDLCDECFVALRDFFSGIWSKKEKEG